VKGNRNKAWTAGFGGAESKPWVMNVHVNTVIKIIAANNSDYAPAHAAIAA
jgi:hypothetical protein